MRLLAGDIGGTKTQLALFEGAEATVVRELPSARYAGLCEALDEFLRDAGVDARPIAAAAFGVAGPVTGDVVRVTNLPWTVEAAAVAAHLGTPAVRLLNDLEAAALGLERLGPEDVVTLQQGARDPAGPRVLIGAGTGLGKAVRVPTDGGPRVLRSEGGHASFAPADTEGDALLAWLRGRRPHVAVEDVVSGPGLTTLFSFLVETKRAPTALRAPADAARISAGAQDGDPAATRALEWFVRLYGAEAGNLALNVLPTGGLYVTGGVAPKLHRVLGVRFGALFLEGMLAKGPMQGLLEAVPVQLVLRPELPLLGAAVAAEALARD